MDLSKIPFGKNFPSEVNVVVEIPQNSIGLKYEIDKDSGAVFVDRFLTAPMFYPANYGFVPNTLGGDGDPIDVLVVSPFAIQAGAVIPSKVIGVLIMEDEGGMDEKIIAVPASSISKEYENVKEIEDLPELLIKQIKHFFERYKDLEKNKWVKVQGFKDANEAKNIIEKSKK
jgi:inorganic pyrophosphatase